MTNYENDIMILLRGKSPKEKYEFLLTLIDVAFCENEKCENRCKKCRNVKFETTDCNF